ncbi:MAG: branched-chain amino acid ABC transporter permease [Nitrospirae bacterium]|nr:branched-chain amino acid ABC transporter permease [Nitrospirota bacterium]MBF0534840.1 branched-chain amino acid ABC transporter permease [Nitrospirota bacterium]MBF0616755.1 branched-chain amino acid ABC transporter permease [Nitrospirota bacterium]
MHLFIEQLINGITLGSIYSLTALGLTLIFGVLDILNMAHGAVFMFGAFTAVLIVSKLGLPLWVGFLGGCIVSGLLGYALELFALRPLRRMKNSSPLAPLISTIGVSIILENIARALFGSDTISFRTSISEINFKLGDVDINLINIVILAVSFTITILLYVWLKNSKSGRALRAVSENPDTAAFLGVNTSKVITFTVVSASCAGGAAGVLVAMAFNSVNNEIGLAMGLKGLAIIILGGMGSVNGAVTGGILLGLAETFVVAYGDSGYKEIIGFIIIMAVLLIKPQGLFGTIQKVKV